MKALVIVETLDIREQVALGVVPGGVGPMMYQLGLQRVEEAFHWHVVQRVGPPAVALHESLRLIAILNMSCVLCENTL